MSESASAFRELRLAAGYTKIPQLAAKLGVYVQSVYSWDRGQRPSWASIVQLSPVLGVDAAELVRVLWKEKVGDPCECGCGSKKVFPTDFPDSRQLAFERSARLSLRDSG
jgi:transcriptional regulator with XRE-family HTH domain